MRCNHDCFNCIYDDCINDKDYKAPFSDVERKRRVETASKWNAEHPERVKEIRQKMTSQPKYHQKHYMRYRDYYRDYYIKNKEKIRERNRLSYLRRKNANNTINNDDAESSTS